MEPLSPMPGEIAKAIVEIMSNAKQLGFDEKNKHADYSYASIDKFLSAMRPLCAEAGLIILLDEAACEFREGPPNREGKVSSYAFLDYHVWLIHSSGVTWGPLTRRIALPATGPQAFGAAESYVLKRFMRNLFQIPTGEKDADDLPEGSIPSKGRSGAHQTQERPAPAQTTGNGASASPAPAETPHDADTGEIVSPYTIPLGKSAKGGHDFVTWGSTLIRGAQTAMSQAEIDDWEGLNVNAMEAAKGTRAYTSVQSAIAAVRSKIGPDNVIGEDEAETALRDHEGSSDGPQSDARG